jgi:hypothetical protein
VLVSVNGGAQQSLRFPASFGTGGPVNARRSPAHSRPRHLRQHRQHRRHGRDRHRRLGTNATLKFDDGPSSSGLLAPRPQRHAGRRHRSGATGTTDLAQLTARTAAYQSTATRITVSGTNPDGTAFSDTFVYGAARSDGTTIDAC